MPFPYTFPFYFEDAIPVQTFVVWVNNVDVTSSTLLGASFTKSFSAVGTLNISFESAVVITLGLEVKVFDITLNKVIFAGTVREATKRQQTYNRYVTDCVVHDYTRAIYDVDDGVTGLYTGTEKEVLTALFAAYCPTISVGANVIDGNGVTITPNNASLKDAIDLVRAGQGNRLWYVDDLKDFHYFDKAGTWQHTDFDVSDTPNETTTFPFHAFNFTQDNVGAGGSAERGSLKLFRSGLHPGELLEVTNSVLSIANHYPIGTLSGKLLTTLNANIQWEYTVYFSYFDAFETTYLGYRSNNKITSRLTEIPLPTQAYQIANKKYVDTKVKRIIEVVVVESETSLTVADGQAYISIPIDFNGYNLIDADATVITPSSSGLPSIAIYNVTDSQDMLSVNITIDANEKTSFTAETQPTISTSYDDVATGDELRIDVDAIGTGTKGLIVILTFCSP